MNKKKTKESEFLELINSLDDYELIEYPTEKKYYAKIKHLKCGLIYTKRIHDFIRGDRCPNKKCIQIRKKINYKSIQKKSKMTNLKKYGVEHPSQISGFKEKVQNTWKNKSQEEIDLIIKNREQTSIKKYGVSHHFKNQEIYNKMKSKIEKKYNCEYISQTNEFKTNVKKTRYENHYKKLTKESEFLELINSLDDYELIEYPTEKKYYAKTKHLKCGTISEIKIHHFLNNHRCKNKKCQIDKRIKTKQSQFYNQIDFKNVEPLFDLKDFHGVYIDEKNITPKLYKWKCLICENEFEDGLENGRTPRCPVCFPTNISSYEKEISYWLNELNISHKNNKRFYYNKNHYHELDIYIPDKNIGIEFNGIYYHSELKGKTRNYHRDKTNFFLGQNIQVLHIFENEWIKKQDIVKSIIKSKLGLSNRIYARKTEIKEVDSKSSRLFLEENHIQGFVGSKIKLGLYHQDKLVSLMTFGKSRYSKYDWELLRFVNKLNTTIVGGFSKLLSYFKKNYSGNIISYADRRYSTGNVYFKNGFKLSHVSQPDYFYFKETNPRKLYHRSSFQKHKLKNKLDNFNLDLSEWGNMKLNRYNRIWDCGNLVFIMESK